MSRKPDKPRTRRGGARPGAGRKPIARKTSTNPALQTDDPIAWLTACMQDERIETRVRVDAAKALLALQRDQERIGKKGVRLQSAARAGTGRFAPGSPPKLSVVRDEPKPA